MDSIQKEMEYIIKVRNAEEREIESNMDLIRKLENYVENQGVKVPK